MMPCFQEIKKILLGISIISIFTLQGAEWGLFTSFSRWDNDYSPQELPESFLDNMHLDLPCHGENNLYSAIMIGNSTAKGLDIRITLTSLNPEAAQHMNIITLREAMHIRSRSGALRADPLPEVKSGYVMFLPGLENSQLFLDLNTSSLENGVYKWLLTMSDLQGNQRTVSITLTIQRYFGEEIFPYILVWDCSLRSSKGKMRENMVRELGQRGVNVFHVIDKIPVDFNADGSIRGDMDFRSFDEVLKSARPYGKLFLIRACNVFAQNARRNRSVDIKCHDGIIKYKSKQWYRALKEWLFAFSSHMRKYGFDYDDWALYPYDEYLGKYFEDFVEAVRKSHPNIRIFANPAGKISPEKLTLLTQKGLIDIVCPFGQRYYGQDETRHFLQKNMHPHIWKSFIYFCGWPQKDFSPLKFYLTTPWRMLQNGNDGGGFWTATGIGGNLWGGDPWNDFDQQHPNPDALYYINDEVISSRRFLAFSEGIEDWRIVEFIRNKCSVADRKKLNHLIGEILNNPDDFNKIKTTRDFFKRWMTEMAYD